MASSLTAGGGGAGQNKWGNTYGLSPQFLESLWINGPLVTRVFVANVSTLSSQCWLKLILSANETFMKGYKLVNIFYV